MGRRATGTVEARTASIRLKFVYRGKRQVEVLDLAPTPANLKAAEKLLARVVGAIAVGVYRREDHFEGTGPSSYVTFADYVDDWEKTLSVAKSTKRSYITAMTATWKPAFGAEPLTSIKFSDVKKAIAAKVAGGASGKTVNNHLIPLHDLFNMARRDGLISTDPTEGISYLPHQKREPDPFTPEERDLILADMSERYHDQVYNYFVMAFGTGLRPSEQIVVGWGDIDWNRRKVQISKALVDGEVKATKTNLIREVALSDAVIEALTRQKAHTFLKNPEGPIFEDPLHGAPYPNERAQRRRYFIPTLRRLGIRHRDAYQTRHTFATTLLMGGVNPAYISKQLGHTTTAMLFKHYTKWIENADNGAETAKANALLSAQSSPNSPTRVTGT